MWHVSVLIAAAGGRVLMVVALSVEGFWVEKGAAGGAVEVAVSVVSLLRGLAIESRRWRF